MLPGAAARQGDGLLDDGGDARAVDVLHCKDVDPRFPDALLLLVVQVPDADQHHVVRVNLGAEPAQR